MAASAWEMFDVAKKHIGNNTVSLSATTGYNMTLHSQTASTNLSLNTITSWGSIGSEITAGNKYAAGGLAISGTGWTVGASAGQYKFVHTSAVFSASGGAWTSVRYAVIMFSTGATEGRPLCYAALSTVGFSVADGNTLTIIPNASGVFTLA